MVGRVWVYRGIFFLLCYCFNCDLAEREGFEPSLGVNLNTISSRALSTTQPPLLTVLLCRTRYAGQGNRFRGNRPDFDIERHAKPCPTTRLQAANDNSAEDREDIAGALAVNFSVECYVAGLREVLRDNPNLADIVA